MVAFTDQNFDEEVLNAEGLVVVDFFASWCGPCKMLTPVLEELSEDFKGKAKIGKISTEENPVIPQKYGIMSIPCVKFFKGGEEVAELVGYRPKEDFENKINELM